MTWRLGLDDEEPMRNRFAIAFGGLLAAMLVLGYRPASVVGLNRPERLVLYSIDGGPTRPDSVQTSEPPSKEKFHGYPVLGKVELTDADKLKEISDAIKSGLARSDGSMAACFWPRHAIRSVENGRTIDFVICFECSQLQIHQDNSVDVKPITRDPRAVLNKVLNESGIPLAAGMVKDGT
jgi:hypothetical protein